MKNIETYLPIFPGFYGTIFEANEEREINYINEKRAEKELRPIEYDECDFDYKSYNDSMAFNCVCYAEGQLQFLFPNIKIEFQRVNSPHEYNFTNDEIAVSIKVSNKTLKDIKNYLINNNKEFDKYIKDRFTSRSGFISFYSNSSEVWINELFNDLSDTVILGSVLDFILINEGIEEDDMYDHAQGNCSGVETKNFNELTK